MVQEPSGLGRTATDAAGVPNRSHLVVLIVLASGFGLGFTWAPRLTLTAVHHGLVAIVVLAAALKVALTIAPRRDPREPPPPSTLPAYTILAPLYREASVLPQLIEALEALRYPRHQLEAYLILERDDLETRRAASALRLPPFIRVFLNDAAGPRTKPNALNAALPYATGEHLVIYDAEDRPDPLQLIEAAARFAGDPTLVCLQAPLRIANSRSGFLARQFALDYAGQFEAITPGLVALGAPFPLGGTSNHFRTSALRRAGGWDPFNVTEDADLGFRLASRGARFGMLRRPTWEDAPTTLAAWLPQRTRWLKGFIQTWMVHMRRSDRLGLKGFVSLQATVGTAIIGAAAHGPCVLLLASSLLIDVATDHWSTAAIVDIGVLLAGWGAAVATKARGARCGGLRLTAADAIGCLAYWPLLTVALIFAVEQLIRRPFHWDKTEHEPTQAKIGGSVTDQSPIAA